SGSVRLVCGIVGLFSKSSAVSDALGTYVGAMLSQLSDRGPDSAGLAVYRDPAPPGTTKVTLWSADPAYPWAEIGATQRASHGVLVVEGTADEAVAWVRREHPELRVMSAGEAIEIYKEMGRPRRFVERFDLERLSGSHAVGHTRMATESRVT